MDDQTIIKLYWSRAETAVAETAVRYGGYCRAIAYSILRDPGEAEECENDTWLAAWNGIPPARPDVLKSFLGRLTRNIALNRYDRRTAKKRNGGMDVLLSELGECIPSGESVEQAYAARQLPGLISAFLRELDGESRNLFLRRYWYCDSVAELARRFSLGEGGVKSRLFRLRGRLRDYLEREGISC